MSEAQAAYEALERRFGRIGALSDAASILGWDQSAMMPVGAAEGRGEQLAALAVLSQELLTADATADALAGAEASPIEDPWRARNLLLMRRAHRRATALPPELVEARARGQASCEVQWRSAKADNDWDRIAGPLGGMVEIVRAEARLLGGALGLEPYDALLDGYQTGIGRAEIEALFTRYEVFLADMLPAVEAAQARMPAPVALPGPVTEAAQARVCRSLAERAGLDFSHGRLDTSLHPFCGGTPDDVRITTRYDPNEPSRALMGVLHETGHALYERGLPVAWRRQPVGQAAGMAAHESQSLLVEMQACRSDAFLRFLGPVLAAAYGGEAAAYHPDNLGRLWRRVERSLIRVDADEITYPAHVILRFRLELAMVEGRLEVGDLPGAWSEGLHGLLGVRPHDHRSGCLQDIHWYAGLFGYFPSYSLGAMAAAQLMGAARADLSDLDEALARGDLSGLMGWLGERVHAQGALLGFNDLLEGVTGSRLDPAAFEGHLRSRYLRAN